MAFHKELIVMELQGTDKEAVIEELTQVALTQHKVKDQEAFKDSIYYREKLFSTAIGHGIAIPHGKSETVEEPLVIFARSSEGVKWDDEVVHLVFLMGIPDEGAENSHLRILAKLSRKLMDGQFVALLKEANSQEEALEVLNQIQLELE